MPMLHTLTEAPSARPLATGPREKRRQYRLPYPPLFVDGIGALALDVSREGIGVLLDGPVRRGQRHRLRLRDAIDESEQEILVEVMWCTEQRAGCRWIGMTAEQETWIGRRFSAWLGALEGASRR
jgi:hypothetical protein